LILGYALKLLKQQYMQGEAQQLSLAPGRAATASRLAETKFMQAELLSKAFTYKTKRALPQ
jgi:hypothetical protein